MNQTIEHYNYLIVLVQDYLNTLPQSSKIAVTQMADVSLAEMKRVIEAIPVLENEVKKLTEKLQQH